MSDSSLSRRRFIAGTAAVGVATIGATASTVAGSSDWSAVSSPTGNALYDAVYANGRPYAVGASGNLLVRKNGSWSIENKHFAKKNKTLHAAATTADGGRIWAAGSSGMVGYYDVSDPDTVSYKKPVGNGNSFHDVVVVGKQGSERVFLGGPSGHVVVGHHDSNAKNGMAWSLYKTGGGYTVNGLAFRSKKEGFAVTSGSTVYKTTDGGQSWREIGIPNAQVPFHDVVALKNHVYVSAGAGHLYRLDCTCRAWTPFKAGSNDVSALTHRNGRFLGVGSSGTAYRKTDTGWATVNTPTGNGLHGVVPGVAGDASNPGVAVGDSGTILER